MLQAEESYQSGIDERGHCGVIDRPAPIQYGASFEGLARKTTKQIQKHHMMAKPDQAYTRPATAFGRLACDSRVCSNVNAICCYCFGTTPQATRPLPPPFSGVSL